MVCVFSFSLFGSENKYCKGLLKNIAIIEKEFPDWKVWVYCGDGIPEDILLQLSEYPFVKLIPTMVCGMENKFHRFFSIDDPEVEISIIRDADSRIYERDKECINEFIKSNQLAQIIRDHPNHNHPIMAGMWGIKRGLLDVKISDLFTKWVVSYSTLSFWDDTHFLSHEIYPRIMYNSIIFDEFNRFEPMHIKYSFKTQIENGEHFVGQVYEYDTKGNEYPKFNYFTK